MYTVKELIEALKECPEDSKVLIHAPGFVGDIESVGIDPDEKTVDLFAEI